ncbi:tyrosine-protein phosphatase [Streptomyces albireticuli]|uniref:Protein tyrosine phosphatase n=1 Tax=Streptomyces albireticuli TaxID=1940 RepID=A0A2A2D317_9ACTN|nr:tyrosine-protein phosphatase [Streptomyces albireticuli]MCD9140939.1 tyrosine-protein phosphatase [Streptomyces albireticuli]MCD9161099.1 tyrosine-protein phosphatase [Streptomyces albireticuli]MCD9190843.1 tyrosine-protein phosphatase [Streptomyces albireticuli]PAU45924.1 protein tyrosine phosphatase [Streptomyces albireticuli]
MTQTPHVPSTEPELTGVRNFRDLGGLPAADGRRVRPGVLFRSGHLAHATESDARFLGSLGLHTVFDFRNAADIELDGRDIELTGVRNVNIPLNDPADGAEFWRMVRARDLTQLRSVLSGTRGADRMTETYREIITTRTAEHARVLRALAEDAVPALMHCAAGKDRAGLSIAVTLLALGASRETVEADYLKSNAPHRRYRMRRAEGAGEEELEVAELLAPMFEARAEYLAEAFTTIEEIWGTTERYLTRGLGFGGADRERLRARLLTD